MAYNKRQHLADNIAALELIFMRPEFCLTEEGRKVFERLFGFRRIEVHPESGGKDADVEKMSGRQGAVSPSPTAA